jgi:hypothetical protein
MTLFEKMCQLLLALEHDLRNPVGVLKGDLGSPTLDELRVARMARQVERILGIIPPVERIMTEVIQGEIVADIKEGGKGTSWFVEQVRLLGVALDGRTSRLSLNGAELQILFEPVDKSNNISYEIVDREFASFGELFEALKSDLPAYVLITDSIIEYLGWNLSLRIL